MVFFLIRSYHEKKKESIFHFGPILAEIGSVFLLFSQFSVFSIYAESTFCFNGTLEQWYNGAVPLEFVTNKKRYEYMFWIETIFKMNKESVAQFFVSKKNLSYVSHTVYLCSFMMVYDAMPFWLSKISLCATLYRYY